MQIRGKFFHLDETCTVFKFLRENEACFYKSMCDAICKVNDGKSGYKQMREEIDFRAFPVVWKKKEREILAHVARLIMDLEEKGNIIDVKRIKAAYGFDTTKRMNK
ncbi:MAG: hypothetical protein U9N45_03525 [Gemmatimonadota bacterium]|nr:hypothetical protein [Gemmatimonadota bacterium]